MAVNCGRGPPIEIEERVCNEVWQLIVEDVLGRTNQRRLVKAWREADLQETINGAVW